MEGQSLEVLSFGEHIDVVKRLLRSGRSLDEQEKKYVLDVFDELFDLVGTAFREGWKRKRDYNGRNMNKAAGRYLVEIGLNKEAT